MNENPTDPNTTERIQALLDKLELINTLMINAKKSKSPNADLINEYRKELEELRPQIYQMTLKSLAEK